ncbi:hypothetical protein FDP41_003004 [Naegleria fowleri]|uniref:Uncharacterized protein n=1 Tax=Naegleria fowleri TaxID=5763 RepID=A0A6A5BSK1_NAEFO|nr:uncharacterized protein FDP41_003004 [Naegleria fowleri]KAF0977682.1 hypothetical protein FDP41_003004 [Naegleria fowleri]
MSTSNLGENILYGIGCTTDLFDFFLSPKDQSKNALQVFRNMLFELRHDNNYCLFNRMLHNAISYDKYGRFGIEIKTSLSPTIVTRMRKLKSCYSAISPQTEKKCMEMIRKCNLPQIIMNVDRPFDTQSENIKDELMALFREWNLIVDH